MIESLPIELNPIKLFKTPPWCRIKNEVRGNRYRGDFMGYEKINWPESWVGTGLYKSFLFPGETTANHHGRVHGQLSRDSIASGVERPAALRRDTTSRVYSARFESSWAFLQSRQKREIVQSVNLIFRGPVGVFFSAPCFSYTNLLFCFWLPSFIYAI